MQHRAQLVAIKLKKLLPHLMEVGLAIKAGRKVQILDGKVEEVQL